MITEKQLQLVQNKYGNLIYKVSHQITGDTAVCSIEDNVQDLWIAVLEAVKGFEKQNGGANGKFDDFWGTKGFDKYIKTCIWSAKNSKGSRIAKKKNLLSNSVSIEGKEDFLEMPNFDYSHQVFDGESFCRSLNKEEREVMDIVVSNPSLLKDTGGINVSALSRKMNVENHQARKVVKSIYRKFDINNG